SAGTTVAISDAVQIANAPLGATTTFAYVFDFGGRVYLGPGQNGTGGIRMLPDGSSSEPLTFAFRTDPVNGNRNTAIKTQSSWPTLGSTNCTLDTLQCGPDNENGRGLFESGTVAGTPWLIASGAKTTSAHKGGIIRSTSNDPHAPLLSLLASWATSTPKAAAYAGKSSLTTKKTFDLEPADKAFPQMAAFGGRLFAAGNTTSGPQLWVCA